MNDATYRWFILIPDRHAITEICQLDKDEQHLLIDESTILSNVLIELFNPDKLNIAALGNVVPQLHLHHIVRYRKDPAWPKPVWGNHTTSPYTEEQLDSIIVKMKSMLSQTVDFAV